LLVREPFCLPLREIDRLARCEVFEIYLEPEKKDEPPQRTHREIQFDHWLRHGYAKDWQECERKWKRLHSPK